MDAATAQRPLEHNPSPTIEPFCRFWTDEAIDSRVTRPSRK
jgi:hypothetical protein